MRGATAKEARKAALEAAHATAAMMAPTVNAQSDAVNGQARALYLTQQQVQATGESLVALRNATNAVLRRGLFGRFRWLILGK